MSRVLVVYWWPEELDLRSGVASHLRALERGQDEVVYLNAARPWKRRYRQLEFDAVLLHNTFLCLRWDRAFAAHRRAWAWLGELDCPKVAVPQDEYNHSETLEEWLAELGVGSILSCFDQETRLPIYPGLGGSVRFRTALTGYIDPRVAEYCARRARPPAQRPFDLVYRATRPAYWFGSHGQLKHGIGVLARERALARGLRVDISTRLEDTILGDRWLDFLMAGRAIVGVESGSSVLDRRGEIQRRIRELLALDPKMTFEEVDARMPAGWDSYAFFAIGPRHLEAVITKTCQILVEGTYSHVLEPEQHYIPVRRDLGDLDEALERITDDAYVEDMVNRAYRDVYEGGRWTTDGFARELRDAMEEEREHGRRRPALPGRPRSAAANLIAGVASRRTATPTKIRLLAPALGALRRRPRLAALLLRRAASGSLRGVSARELGRDLVRLGLLDRFERAQRELGGPWRVQLTRAGSDLRLESVRRPAKTGGPIAVERSVERIIWDHSDFAPAAALDPRDPEATPVSLGDHGCYTFTALSRLVRAEPSIPSLLGLDPYITAPK